MKILLKSLSSTSYVKKWKKGLTYLWKHAIIVVYCKRDVGNSMFPEILCFYLERMDKSKKGC